MTDALAVTQTSIGNLAFPLQLAGVGFLWAGGIAGEFWGSLRRKPLDFYLPILTHHKAFDSTRSYVYLKLKTRRKSLMLRVSHKFYALPETLLILFPHKKEAMPALCNPTCNPTFNIV